jgi:hypothetical protein
VVEADLKERIRAFAFADCFRRPAEDFRNLAPTEQKVAVPVALDRVEELFCGFSFLLDLLSLCE